MARTLAVVVLTGLHKLPSGVKAGFWLPDAAYTWLALHSAGWRVVAVSTREGRPAQQGVDRSDPVQRGFLGDPGILRALEETARPESLDADRVGVLVFAGGVGALWDLPGDRCLAELTGHVVSGGGWVAACCQGVAALLNVRLPNGAPFVKERRLTAFSQHEEQILGIRGPLQLQKELAGLGARYSSNEPFRPHVVRDGRLITGQNPASLPKLSRLLTRLKTT
ncbi:type 1 glutamine amidotransferase domain-containing protein [Nonomuraea typhae]|uniref:Type 1 glutamine amidotransferase domain-containing protein n=1 Tax=Nonomuraea typhae TaxID=2603600 RepID=A0ABW7ZBG4_9ACTN